MDKPQPKYTVYYVEDGQHAFTTCYTPKSTLGVVDAFHRWMQINLEKPHTSYFITRVVRGDPKTTRDMRGGGMIVHDDPILRKTHEPPLGTKKVGPKFFK